MVQQRIAVDSFELLRPEGTGLATYSRMLLDSLGRLGIAPDLVVARRLRGPADPLARAVGFFGAEPGVPRRRARLLTALRLPVDLLRPVPLAAVPPGPVRRDLVPGLPAESGWLAAPWLRGRAYAHLRATGRPLRLRLPPGTGALILTAVMPLLAENAPTLVMAPDLIPLTHPDLVVDPPQRFLRSAVATLPRASHIITCSASSRAALIEHLGIPAERITIAWLPAERPVAAPLAPALARFGLVDDGFLLFAGAVEPKKNLPRLFDAYAASGCQAPLVLVGPDGWHVERELTRMGQRLAGEARILRLGWLPPHDLAALMSACRAFVFPSRTEGFGLPALEAMAAGAAVIAGSRDGLAEVVGNAGLLVDPDRPMEIAAAIARVDEDEALRRSLRQRARLRAGTFTAERFDAAIVAALDAAGVPRRAALPEAPALPVSAGAPA
jgi:glycosyltransferase involved in cell wall biosynthesis